jgi:hypothetical protein
MSREQPADIQFAPFERVFFESGEPFMQIGAGDIGGKAAGLLKAGAILAHQSCDSPDGRVRVEVPSTVVVATEVFETFMERNGLYEVALSGAPDERIAHAFQGAEFPHEYVGDLMALIQGTGGRPLAIRSSSLLEDALRHPFAGVYDTKMIPNNQTDTATRFRRLIEAIRFVYASTFFEHAAHYIRAIGKDSREERMAVIVQEVVGKSFGDRFYPEVSGVSRSYNYYRTGTAKPHEGVASLALGLGKTIVDGGTSWSYSPAHPRVTPPFASERELMKNTQLRFWAINLGTPPAFDPTKETEYLVEPKLADADYDGALKFVASTYDSSLDRVMAGVGSPGPRVIDFAPLLRLNLWPVNDVIKLLLEVFERETGNAVEIEFAVTFSGPAQPHARLVVLQVRPMMVSQELIDLSKAEREDPGLLVYSKHVMGNGSFADLKDIVYVKPEVFEARLTGQIARELESVNTSLQDEGRRYVLIGFGRWGSSEPWLGIPVNWGQISGASVIIEATLPQMNVEPSQGSHFFHNIQSFEVSYFCVHHKIDPPIDWEWLSQQAGEWLSQQAVVNETDTLRHIRSSSPLKVKADGRSGHGAIWHE